MVNPALEKIKQFLTSKDKKVIAEKEGVSIDTVNKVLRNERRNDNVVKRALKHAQKNRDAQEKINQQAQQL